MKMLKKKNINAIFENGAKQNDVRRLGFSLARRARAWSLCQLRHLCLRVPHAAIEILELVEIDTMVAVRVVAAEQAGRLCTATRHSGAAGQGGSDRQKGKGRAVSVLPCMALYAHAAPKGPAVAAIAARVCAGQ